MQLARVTAAGVNFWRTQILVKRGNGGLEKSGKYYGTKPPMIRHHRPILLRKLGITLPPVAALGGIDTEAGSQGHGGAGKGLMPRGWGVPNSGICRGLNIVSWDRYVGGGTQFPWTTGFKSSVSIAAWGARAVLTGGLRTRRHRKGRTST